MSKPVILTGLRANNDLHLGNYLGALFPIVKMQEKYAGEYQINLFVPDLHSFTTPIDHSQLYVQTMHNLRLFVASGLKLDDKDTFVYRQSFIPAHSELTVILNCFTYMGELNRMTQFKEKTKSSEYLYLIKNLQDRIDNNLEKFVKKDRTDEEKIGYLKNELFNTLDTLTLITQNELNKDSIGVGLFEYPVLMAADILLYGAKYVPVGADQTQHVELARDIAIRMNNKFGELFTPPEAEKQQIAFAEAQERLRIRDLADPAKKMSKSDDSGKGVIFLGDTPETAAKKIMSATTDSYGEIKFDMQERPGVSNLLVILSALSGRELAEVIKEYEGQTQYGPLKQATADVVQSFLGDFQTKLGSVDQKAIEAKLAESELAMNEAANLTLTRVQKAVGLRP